MSFPINRTSLAAVLAALANRWPAKDLGGCEVMLRPPPPWMTAPTRLRKFRTWLSSAPQIKQGARECARRQGGRAWAEFKAADRVRRGLAPFRWVARNDGEAQAMVAAWRKANLGIVAVWEDV